jgi:hypothetical protein
LNNGHFFGVPRVAVVDRFDCTCFVQDRKKSLQILFFAFFVSRMIKRGLIEIFFFVNVSFEVGCFAFEVIKIKHSMNVRRRNYLL